MDRRGRLDTIECVGVVGAPVDAVPGLGTVCADAGVELVTDIADVAAERAVVICVGRNALATVADTAPEIPVLPVGLARAVGPDADPPTVGWYRDLPSVPSISRDETATAVSSLCQSGGRTRALSTLTVSRPASSTAAFDVTLVTDEPGTLTKLAVDADGDRVDDVRADGVVVATPAGSRGYARAVGGPTLDPSAGQVAIVPIAPFAIRHPPWVGRPDALRIEVRGDGPATEIQCDGVGAGTVQPGSTVDVERGPSLAIVRPDDASEAMEDCVGQ